MIWNPIVPLDSPEIPPFPYPAPTLSLPPPRKYQAYRRDPCNELARARDSAAVERNEFLLELHKGHAFHRALHFVILSRVPESAGVIRWRRLVRAPYTGQHSGSVRARGDSSLECGSRRGRRRGRPRGGEAAAALGNFRKVAETTWGQGRNAGVFP